MKDSSAAIYAQVPVDVATFLLNEKRSDINRIEQRFKVRITLIPNPHMETPHYSVDRLRMDDITPEHLQASYKQVVMPEEAKPVTATPESKIAQRPQAAVRSITPMQPAPKHTEKVVAQEKKTSLLGSLFGWIKSLGGESEPEKPAAETRKSGSRNNGRRERGDKRRDRGERGEKADKGERTEKGERSENGKKARRERDEAPRQAGNDKEQQSNRKERQPRPPRQEIDANKPVLESLPVATPEQQAQEGQPREGGRKRGRRGGRRERERREQLDTPAMNDAATSSQASQSTAAPQAAAPARIKPSEYVAYPEGMARPVKPTEIVCHPTNKPVAVQAPAAEIVQTTAPVAAPAVANSAPISLDLNGSGLTLIETDPNKAASVVIPAPEMTAHAPRRRQRPREVYTIENSEPLQQVETRSGN
jgi:ribonuclease E